MRTTKIVGLLFSLTLGFVASAHAGDGEREGNLGIIAGGQVNPISSGVYGLSLNHVRAFNWGGGLQFTWQPYTNGLGYHESIYQINFDGVFYIPQTDRGLYLGIIGGINIATDANRSSGQVYGDLGVVAGWDIHLQPEFSIGVEAQDVAAPVFGTASTNELNVLAVVKFWGSHHERERGREFGE